MDGTDNGVMDAREAATLIAARCPEIPSAELSLIEAALNGDVVPSSALEDVLTVLDALEARLDAFIETPAKLARAG
jgi:hypothetical protein